MPLFPPISVELSTGGRPLRLHLVSTGGVAVKTRYREARFRGIPALLDFMADPHFTDWLPIWVLVIEHPEGVFLVDTGENARVCDPDYFASSGFIPRWFDTRQFHFKVTRAEEIDRQLEALSIPVASITKIFLTHLHFDHTDGLSHFPGVPVLLNRLEWEKPFGTLPKLLPAGFNPSLVEVTSPYDVFERAAFLTGARDILFVHTPGHTYGHTSVLIHTDTGPIFFAADICYSAAQLEQRRFTGANASHRLARDTYTRVRAFAQKHPTVFLPSHDPGAGGRLQLRQILPGA